ncbi:MAG: ATP-binding protein [Thermoflexales bacterium]|nr:ATP-binding protein [Thermoflexales bacterium]
MGQAQRLTVPGRFEYLAQIAEFVTQTAREAGLTDDDVFHVEMAVDEACSNVIEHAYADKAGEIELSCAVPEYGRLEIVIHDHGDPFDPESVPEPRVGDSAGLDSMQEGGLGLYFMRKLMDEVRFSFAPGHGNTLYMVKRKQA